MGEDLNAVVVLMGEAGLSARQQQERSRREDGGTRPHHYLQRGAVIIAGQCPSPPRPKISMTLLSRHSCQAARHCCPHPGVVSARCGGVRSSRRCCLMTRPELLRVEGRDTTRD